jgi:hypothetical protein
MTLQAMYDRVSKFDLRKEVLVILNSASFSHEVAMLIQSQLGAGVAKSGKRIKNTKTGSDKYSSAYGKYRQELGLQIEHFDIKVTGEWWNSIGVEDATLNLFEIAAEQSEKTDNLNELFGDQLLGLTQENLGILIETFFFPVLKERIEVATGLKFT